MMPDLRDQNHFRHHYQYPVGFLHTLGVLSQYLFIPVCGVVQLKQCQSWSFQLQRAAL